MKQQVASGPQIPDKVYFRIGEVSSLVGVDPHVLRFWESEFKIIKPRRAKSRQRLYRRKDVEALLLIRELLHGQGYTIAGARKLLDQGLPESRVAEQVQQADPVPAKPGTQRLADIKKELKRIQQLLALRSLRF